MYVFNVKGGEEMFCEELEVVGVNNSLIYVDFMIGFFEMDIDGVIEFGEVVFVFCKGDWVF